MTINERLAEEIKNSGKTQKEIANALNIKQPNISDYVNGKILPSLETFAKLCIYLDVSADYILGINKYI